MEATLRDDNFVLTYTSQAKGIDAISLHNQIFIKRFTVQM